MIGKQQVPLMGGVNAFKDPSTLADNELQPSENFSSRVGSDPGLRPGLNFVREVNPTEPWDGRYSNGPPSLDYTQWCLGFRPKLFKITESETVIALMCNTEPGKKYLSNYANQSELFKTYTFGVGQNFLWAPGHWESGAPVPGGEGPFVLPLGVGDGPCSLVMFDGITYAFDGFSNGGYLVANAPTFLNVSPFSYYLVEWLTPQTELFHPQGAAVVGQRMVYYVGNQLFWADSNDPLAIRPEVLTTGFPVSAEDGAPITAIASLGLTGVGSPNGTALAAWTRNTMTLFQGEPAESTALLDADLFGTLQINRLNVAAGCVSQATVTNTPYGTFWVGADDVWWMPFGALPIRVGTKIRNILKQIPPSQSYKICAEYSGGYYRIALWAEGTGPDDTTPLNQMWWLDLNTVVPQNADQAQWYGPHNLVNNDGQPANGSNTPTSGIWAMSKTSAGELMFLQPWKVNDAGSLTASTYGMSLAQLQDGVARDITAPTYTTSVSWVSLSAREVGDVYVPTARTRATVWVCAVAGTTGLTEPDWNVAATFFVTDGSVVWYVKHFSYATNLPRSSYVTPQDMTGNALAMTIQSKEYTLGGEDGAGVGKEKLMDGAEITYIADQPVKVTYSTAPDQTENSRNLDRFLR